MEPFTAFVVLPLGTTATTALVRKYWARTGALSTFAGQRDFEAWLLDHGQASPTDEVAQRNGLVVCYRRIGCDLLMAVVITTTDSPSQVLMAAQMSDVFAEVCRKLGITDAYTGFNAFDRIAVIVDDMVDGGILLCDDADKLSGPCVDDAPKIEDPMHALLQAFAPRENL